LTHSVAPGQMHPCRHAFLFRGGGRIPSVGAGDPEGRPEAPFRLLKCRPALVVVAEEPLAEVEVVAEVESLAELEAVVALVVVVALLVRRRGAVARGDDGRVRRGARADRGRTTGAREAAGRGEARAEVGEQGPTAALSAAKEALHLPGRIDSDEAAREARRGSGSTNPGESGQRSRVRRRVVDALDVERDRPVQVRVGTRSRSGVPGEGH